MAYNPRDHYFKKAKENKFVARSIFKLEEIDQRLKIFKSSQKVLDLGAAPGSWSQYVAKVIGPQGKIIGIDLKPISVCLPNAVFLVGDLLQMDLMAELTAKNILEPGEKFHVVMSDMAPSTTGIKSVDQAKSLELCEMALTVALQNLAVHGHFICKLFHSGEFEGFRAKLRSHFQKVEVVKPDSTRRSSREIFLIGLKRRSC